MSEPPDSCPLLEALRKMLRCEFCPYHNECEEAVKDENEDIPGDLA